MNCIKSSSLFHTVDYVLHLLKLMTHGYIGKDFERVRYYILLSGAQFLANLKLAVLIEVVLNEASI